VLPTEQQSLFLVTDHSGAGSSLNSTTHPFHGLLLILLPLLLLLLLLQDVCAARRAGA
jgi:hypothetical protein